MRGRQNDCLYRSDQQRHARGSGAWDSATAINCPETAPPTFCAQSTSACPHGLHILAHAYRVPTQLKLVRVREGEECHGSSPSRYQGHQCAVFPCGWRDNMRNPEKIVTSSGWQATLMHRCAACRLWTRGPRPYQPGPGWQDGKQIKYTDVQSCGPRSSAQEIKHHPHVCLTGVPETARAHRCIITTLCGVKQTLKVARR